MKAECSHIWNCPRFSVYFHFDDFFIFDFESLPTMVRLIDQSWDSTGVGWEYASPIDPRSCKLTPRDQKDQFLGGPPVFSALHNLSIANVILSSVHFLSLPVSLSFLISRCPSLFPHFSLTFDYYSLRPFMYSFLPHMLCEGRSCLGNIIRPSSGLHHPLLSCSLSARDSFVMFSGR